MKTAYKILFAAFCCLLTGGYCAFGAEENIIEKSMKVTVSTAQPPQARTTGTVGINSASSRHPWVQVDVRFRTEDEKNMRRRFLDNPELAVELAVMPQNSKEKCVVFSGKVKYWFLEQDGKDHYMKMLLPALFFRRFADGRSVDRVVLAAKAVVSLGGKGSVVGYGSTKGLAVKEITAFFRRLPAKTLRVEGAMVGRQGSPWSMIEVNRYEYEKQPWLAGADIQSAGESSEPEEDKKVPVKKSGSKKKRTKKNR